MRATGTKSAMITRTRPSLQNELPDLRAKSWQKQLQEAIRCPKTLLKRLQLPVTLAPSASLAGQQFPLLVPEAFLNKIKTGDINDPLLRQVLPIQEELIASTGFGSDPVGEQGNPQAGLIQKYHGRALLMVNGHCAVNCRYCFRRHFPYEQNRLSKEQWQAVIDTIANDISISEIIYSGGDPLASSDKQLQWLTQRIAHIPHVKRLRIHSRLPVVIPERINDECLHWLSHSALKTVFVLHINHANEIDTALAVAVNKLKSAGVTVLNQSVLLKGVNDSEQVLNTLSETLFENGILPYYLHQLDKVAGAAHFAVSEARAKALHQHLLATLPGYLVPALVSEIAGASSKTPL